MNAKRTDGRCGKQQRPRQRQKKRPSQYFPPRMRNCTSEIGGRNCFGAYVNNSVGVFCFVFYFLVTLIDVCTCSLFEKIRDNVQSMQCANLFVVHQQLRAKSGQLDFHWMLKAWTVVVVHPMQFRLLVNCVHATEPIPLVLLRPSLARIAFWIKVGKDAGECDRHTICREGGGNQPVFPNNKHAKTYFFFTKCSQSRTLTAWF